MNGEPSSSAMSIFFSIHPYINSLPTQRRQSTIFWQSTTAFTIDNSHPELIRFSRDTIIPDSRHTLAAPGDSVQTELMARLNPGCQRPPPLRLPVILELCNNCNFIPNIPHVKHIISCSTDDIFPPQGNLFQTLDMFAELTHGKALNWLQVGSLLCNSNQ